MTDPMEDPAAREVGQNRIWWFAFGYFACYAPYSAMTKAITKGLIFPGHKADGFAILPISVLASLCGMFVFE